MSKTLLVVGSMGTAMVLACMAAGLMAVEGASKTQKVTTLVGAGDIAECDSKHDSKTARLLGKIRGTVFTLGDSVYPEGTSAQFSQCYDPTWGTYKERTKPAVGDQDYKSSDAKPYFEYFGERAGEPGEGYYSYDRGSWHIVVLNSNCKEVEGCEERSEQGRWLRRDLNHNPQRCTLAYFHHPLFASGSTHDSPKVKPFWHILYAHKADVILNGHVHRYERFAPLSPSGERSSERGIRQFIVGTGGKLGGNQHGPNEPRVQAKKIGAPGVLKLHLGSGFYHWKFVPVAGRHYTDTGKAQCH